MSEAIVKLAREGAGKIYNLVSAGLGKTLAERGEATAVRFPGTTYFFPLAFALLGAEVKTLGDLPGVLAAGRGLLAPGEEIPPAEAISIVIIEGSPGLEMVINREPIHLLHERHQSENQGFY